MDNGTYLARCVELAREALEDGDDPFGSVLVDSAANVVAESRNRERSLADATAHPEFDLAQWAWRNLDAHERSRATVFTSGEHCPMCAAAHGWVGLGAIVFAASAAQLTQWRTSWGLPASPVAPLPIAAVLPGTHATGPVNPYDEMMFLLHEEAAHRHD
jgi:tRNA(Arg) A34 adenosine deaminase TadA